jgi:hypothetical protein
MYLFAQESKRGLQARARALCERNSVKTTSFFSVWGERVMAHQKRETIVRSVFPLAAAGVTADGQGQ